MADFMALTSEPRKKKKVKKATTKRVSKPKVKSTYDQRFSQELRRVRAAVKRGEFDVEYELVRMRIAAEDHQGVLDLALRFIEHLTGKPLPDRKTQESEVARDL